MPALIKRPQFEDLAPDDQLRFGNGVGNNHMPVWLRQFLTTTASWFFKDASWRHHDFGYSVGGDKWDRRRCDGKFLDAMLDDAWHQPLWIWPLAAPIALSIALVFYAAVRLGGARSFRFQDGYSPLEEIFAQNDPDPNAP